MSEAQLANWVQLAKAAAGLAMVNLSKMTGRGIESSSAVVPAAETARRMSGAVTEVVGVRSKLSGDASGHIIFMYEPESANGFADLLLGRTPGTTTSLSEGERSALAELGENVGGSFLRAVAGAAGLCLAASPPSVVVQQAGTLLSTVACDPSQASGVARVVETTFFTGDRKLRGTLLVVPNADLLQLLSQQRLTA